jgi:23S rRNA (adenine2503-C2)-methyltransferase
VVQPQALFEHDFAQTGEVCRELGFSPRWAGPLRRAVLAGREPELPQRLLAVLHERVSLIASQAAVRTSTPDGAEKFLIRLADGNTVEAVRLPGAVRGSACLSTQVGCAMACRFCASGLEGARRNLAAHEILEQVALLRRSGPVERLVLMGGGEPTQNLGAVVAALDVLKVEGGIGPRHVLLSTVGPPAAIARVTATGLKLTLAVSLHALDRGLRGELIPTQARVEPLDLLVAADAHFAATRRPYQVEYVLLGGVNDSAAQARDLVAALHGRRAHVSLIPWNPVAEQPFAPPAPDAAADFLAILRAAGVSAVLRRTVGSEANAACGQLRIAHARDAVPVALRV